MIFIQLAVIILAGAFYLNKIQWYHSFVFLGLFLLYLIIVGCTNPKPLLSRHEPVLKRTSFLSFVILPPNNQKM